MAKWYRFHECASLPDAGHAPYPWGEFVDLTQGRVYYFNYQTNEVSWHHPGPLVRQQIREAAAACIQARGGWELGTVVGEWDTGRWTVVGDCTMALLTAVRVTWVHGHET